MSAGPVKLALVNANLACPKMPTSEQQSSHVLILDHYVRLNYLYEFDEFLVRPKMILEKK